MRSFTTHAVNANQNPSGMIHRIVTVISQTATDQIGQSGWVRCGSCK